MKKFFNKLSVITLIFFSFSLVNVFANIKEYWAYTKGQDIFFVDDDGEKTVYCYNKKLQHPGSSHKDSKYKTYFTRKEGYLDTNDEFMNIYGKDKKERIAVVLAYGYPIDSSGLISKYGINKEKATKMTQQLIWDICDGKDHSNTNKTGQYGYYNELFELSKTKKFEQGNLDLVGKFEFTEDNGKFLTNKLSTIGSVGSFTITNLPDYMVIKDWKTKQTINDNTIKVGNEFYVESSRSPEPNLKLKINYSYKDLKFYFYTYFRGGINYGKQYQNLIRAELVNKTKEKPYQLLFKENLTVKNNTGSVILTKKDSITKKVLKGAIFKLQDQQGLDIKTNLETNENGQIVVDKLKPGKYQFIETKAPDGYELDETPVEFNIVEGQTADVSVEKTNKAILGGVVLTKKDSKSGQKLEGAVFNLQNQQGADLKTDLKTDTKGQIILNDLTPGDYQFVEKTAPNGYKLDKTPVTFKIAVGQKEAVKVEKTNIATPGSVILTEKDSKSGQELEGAVFNLQNQQGADLKTDLRTDTKGKIILNDLAPGEYQFVEMKAPDGYELDKTPVKFTISVGQENPVKVEKTNILAVTNLKIFKIDSNTKSPLSGAEFEIYSENDKNNPLKFITKDYSSQYESNNTGKSNLVANSSFTISKLKYGDYILKETKTPDGYKLGKDIYIHLDKNNSYYKIGSDGEEITLNKDNTSNSYNISVENEKGIELPETGGNGFIIQRNIALFILGMSFILIINFFVNKRRRIN